MLRRQNLTDVAKNCGGKLAGILLKGWAAVLQQVAEHMFLSKGAEPPQSVRIDLVLPQPPLIVVMGETVIPHRGTAQVQYGSAA